MDLSEGRNKVASPCVYVQHEAQSTGYGPDDGEQ